MFKLVRPKSMIVAGLAGAILAVVSAPQLSTAALALSNHVAQPTAPAISQTIETGAVKVAESAGTDKDKKKKKKKRRKGGSGSYKGS